MRRSPRMIAGCMRETTRPLACASRALAIALSSASASISSAPRSRTSANIEGSAGALRADIARHSARRRPGDFDQRANGFEILGDDPAAVLGKVGEYRRRGLQPEFANEPLVGLDPAIGPDDQRPRRR